ncbi:MAG: leucyl aminopeptidase [bacterium]|nr:leucyl aminopeptidase [bacterium]
MNFEVTSHTLDKVSADAILLFAFAEKDKSSLPDGRIFLTESFYLIDKLLKGVLAKSLSFEDFKAKPGEVFAYNSFNSLLAPKVFVLGLGQKEKFDHNKFRETLGKFVQSTKKINSIALAPLLSAEINFDMQTQSKVITEAFLLGTYKFNRYKKPKAEKQLETVILAEPNKNLQLKMKEGIRLGTIFAQATKLARDLVNEPSAVVNPTFLAQMALDMGKKNKEIKTTVYDREEIEKMGMGAFLGVAQAADTPPKFIVLEYTPGISTLKKRKIAIVGKGITFDSGGISIKPGDSMMTMKLDMSGAAIVLAVFSVISQIKPKFPVVGIIAATPNLISGKSLVPGDVLRAANGKTIEILNTDAEGRVTMADSLYYAVKKGASEIIDFATLTGACEIALGPDITGLFGNNRILIDDVKKAAEKTGEKVWELPLVEEYKKLNKSEVADICNIPSTRYGGAITGALFLEEFIDKKPWVHFDIAGPAYADKPHSLGPKGGTGFGVRLMLEYLMSQN